MKTLKDVKVGETAVVVRLHGEGAVKRRIMDMGDGSPCAQGCAAGRSDGADRARL